MEWQYLSVRCQLRSVPGPPGIKGPSSLECADNSPRRPALYQGALNFSQHDNIHHDMAFSLFSFVVPFEHHEFIIYKKCYGSRHHDLWRLL
jgi:hypothetical protein